MTYHYVVHFTDGSEYSGVKKGLTFAQLYTELMGEMVAMRMDTQCITKLEIEEEV